MATVREGVMRLASLQDVEVKQVYLVGDGHASPTFCGA